MGGSVLFLDTPRAKSGRETIAVSLDIAFPGVALLALGSLVWGFASPASSALVSVSSFDGRVVVILRSEV